MNLRIAVVVYSNLEGAGHSATYRALMVVDELCRAGDDVALVFDGAGTSALAAIISPDSDLHRAWRRAAPALHGACAYCAKSYGVKDVLEAAGVPMLGDDRGHASIRNLLVEGRQLITF